MGTEESVSGLLVTKAGVELGLFLWMQDDNEQQPWVTRSTYLIVRDHDFPWSGFEKNVASPKVGVLIMAPSHLRRSGYSAGEGMICSH